MSKVWTNRFVATLIALVLSPLASAQWMHNEAALEQGRVNYEQYSASNGGNSVMFGALGPTGIPFVSSGGIIRTVDGFSYGITSAHAFLQFGTYSTNHWVGTGLNAQNDRGTELSVAEYWLHPDYGGAIGSSVDVAVFRLDGALGVPNIDIASPLEDEIITFAGFGRQAIPGQGFLPNDGYGRAAEFSVDGFGLGSSEEYYWRNTFRRPDHPLFLPMGGGGTDGLSGSFGYNADGDLTSLATYIQGSGYGMGTSMLDLSHPLVYDWIDSIVPQVPSPGTLVLLGMGGLVASRRRR